jgi:hypothetical protein
VIFTRAAYRYCADVGLFRRKRKVGAAGIPGTARVVDVDTSDFWRTTPNNDHFHLAEIGLGHVVNRLTLEITLNDGRDAYQVTDDFKVPTKFDSHVVLDTRLPVFADPDDPTIVEVNWYAFEAEGGNPPPDAAVTKARLHDEFPDASRTAMIEGWVTAVQMGGMTSAQFDDAIDGALKGGLLDADEADAARRRVNDPGTG